MSTVYVYYRVSVYDYYRGGGVEEGEKPACTGMGAVVVGAGPIGLRSAIELALLGCGVVVLESRQARRVVQ